MIYSNRRSGKKEHPNQNNTKVTKTITTPLLRSIQYQHEELRRVSAIRGWDRAKYMISNVKIYAQKESRKNS